MKFRMRLYQKIKGTPLDLKRSLHQAVARVVMKHST